MAVKVIPKGQMEVRCMNCDTRLGYRDIDVHDRLDENWKNEAYIYCPKCNDEVKVN